MVYAKNDQDEDVVVGSRRIDAPSGHSCVYVARRNALVERAWAVAGHRASWQGSSGYDLRRAEIFHAEMERMVAELYREDKI